jgi:CRP/FNR family transcriptional regulator, nitrogen fixation regulation protein
MAMLTQSIKTSVVGNKISPVARPTADPFCAILEHEGLVAAEFSDKKDEEIYGEDEPAA